MSVAVVQRTLAQVVRDVAYLCGYVLNEGTATAGTTTTLTDADFERTPTAQSNTVTGTHIFVYAGTAVGIIRMVTTYTIGVFTWIKATTAPAANDLWIRTSVGPAVIVAAMAEVTRKAAFKQAIPQLVTSLSTNNLLQFPGDFEEWTNGTTSAPDGWVLAGAGSSIARETVDTNADGTPSGLYHPAVTAGAGAVATLTRNIPAEYLPLIKGKTLTLHGHILEAVAADGVVRVTSTNSANTATNTNRTGTYAGNWEDLEDISTAGIVMPDPVTNLSVQMRAALSATVRFDDLMLYGTYLYDYDLPNVLIGLETTIMMEDGYRSKNFSIPLEFGGDWTLNKRDSVQTNARVLHFLHPLPSGRHLRIKGFRAPDVQDTYSSNVDPNPSWLVHAAAVRLLEQERNKSATRKQDLTDLREELARLERTKEGNTVMGVGVKWIETR